AVRLSRGYRWISLHRFDAGTGRDLARDPFVRPNAKVRFHLPAVFWLAAWVRSRRACLARPPRLRSRFGPRRPGCRRAFPMARPIRGLAGIHSPELDRQLGGFFFASHAAYGHRACLRLGSTSCIGGRINRSRSRLVTTHQLGTWAAHDRVDPVDASDSERLSLEFSLAAIGASPSRPVRRRVRSEEHTSELQSQSNLVCRLLLEKKNKIHTHRMHADLF